MIHDLIDHASYMAHGYCLLWKPWLVALHAGSDLLIAGAYFAIPIAIWIFINRRPNVELRNLARLFAAFILWCGVTHIINLVTLWVPIYEVQGWIKGITAGISVVTAVAIFPLIPKALAIPSPKELQFANASLADEVAAHRKTLGELYVARDELEARVAARTSELADLSNRLRLLFERAPVAMIMSDRNGHITQANSGAAELFGYTVDELTKLSVEDLLPERIRPLHEKLRRIYAKAAEPRPTGLGPDLSARTKDDREIPVEIGLNPIEADGDTYVLASVIDISERRQREEQIKLLMREVNHRSKNMLGVVQSIARHTASTTPQEFAKRFSERVRSLAASQDLLINTDWQGADVEDLLHAQLAHFKDLMGKRIFLKGPKLRLGASAAQTIGMALHELATNAGKYGALSNNAGSVAIDWLITNVRGEDRFRMSWVERGGPSVMPPAVRGFGTTVIEPMARIGLGANVTLDFAESGLQWRLDCPAERAMDTHSIIERPGELLAT